MTIIAIVGMNYSLAHPGNDQERSAREMSLRVGIDVGGTFTDAVMVDDERGEVHRTKVLTTADDQSKGTLEALRRLVDDPSRVASFYHGYTVGLNAALTRTGAKAGM